MDKKMKLCCEPDLSVVWRLLGMRGRPDEEIQKVVDAELSVLREFVNPIALVQSIRADEVLRERAALFQPGEELLAVLLTAGTAGDYVAELFSAGEHLRALVADALLGAWLFAMDDAVQREIGGWCMGHGFGVCSRLEAPEDLPGELQRLICKRLDSESRAGVCVNAGCMLVPEKSMCYLLRLDRDCGRLATGHDCSCCGRKDCGMRFFGKERRDHINMENRSRVNDELQIQSEIVG